MKIAWKIKSKFDPGIKRSHALSDCGHILQNGVCSRAKNCSVVTGNAHPFKQSSWDSCKTAWQTDK